MPDIFNLLDGVVVQAQLDQRCQVREVVNLVNVCTGRLSRAQRMQSGHTNSLLNDKRSIRSSESAGISYVFVSPSSPLPSECCSLTSALMDCMTRPSSTTTDRSRGGSGGPLMLYYPCVTWSCDKTEARIAIDTLRTRRAHCSCCEQAGTAVPATKARHQIIINITSQTQSSTSFRDTIAEKQREFAARNCKWLDAVAWS